MAENYLTIYGKEVTETEFAGWINAQVTKHPVVLKHHGEWKEILAWIEGDQFSIWDESTRTVKPVDLKVRKKKIVINFLKPLVETISSSVDLVSKITGNPNSSEMKDIKGSAVATKLLAYNDTVNAMDDLLEETKFDLFTVGNACEKWVWDKAMKGRIAPKTNGVPDPAKEAEEPGEVSGQAVSIFNLRPDPVARRPKDLRWVIELIELTEEDLLSMYPETEKYLEELREGKEKRYEGMNEDLSEKTDDEREQTYVIKQFWEKKSEAYKKGRLMVVCGNHVVAKDDNPSPKALLPYFWYFYKRRRGYFWSHSPSYYVKDIQREFNRQVSIEAEHIEAWRPKILVGKGALLRENSLTMDDLEIVEVDFSRGEPRPMSTPPLSAEVPAYRDFLLSAKDLVSNVHEVSYSRLPQYASRAPASLYEMMLNQENQKLGPMITQINKTLLEQARFRLMLMAKHYERPRMVKIVGQNKKSTIEYFDKADLAENYDVQLEIGASIHQSTAMTAKLMLELWDKKIFGPEDRNRVIRALNFGTSENDFLTDVVDADRAMRENQMFMDGRGDKVTVYLHDDHTLHLQYHTNLAKTEEAEEWPDKQFAALDQHIENHMILYMNLQAAASEMGAGGGQPGMGTPEMAGIGPAGPGAPTGNAPGPPPGAEAIEGGTPV